MKYTALLLAAFGTSLVHAQDGPWPGVWIPAEVEPFVEAGTKPIAIRNADLNGDGYADYILVLERQDSPDQESDMETGQRPLLLILGGPSRRLMLAKRNDKIIPCSTCGDAMSDAFGSIEGSFGSLWVRHRGGEKSRVFHFSYSQSTISWQLVKSERVKRAFGGLQQAHDVYTAPLHFPQIDISDFDPDAYLNAGVD